MGAKCTPKAQMAYKYGEHSLVTKSEFLATEWNGEWYMALGTIDRQQKRKHNSRLSWGRTSRKTGKGGGTHKAAEHSSRKKL